MIAVNNRPVKQEQNEFASALEEIDLSLMFSRSRYLNPYALFYQLNRVVPSKINFCGVDRKKLLRKVFKQFPQLRENSITSLLVDSEAGNTSLATVLLPLKKDIFLFMGTRVIENVMLIYAPHYAVKELLDYKNIIIDCCAKVTKEQPYINLVYASDEGLAIRPFKVTINPMDLRECYNDDLLPIHNLVLNRLQERKGKGIVLLHGKPGTGKTTYIRHLITLLKKTVIYFPPDLTEAIGQPSFMRFMTDMENCILVIEDAENVVASRKSRTNGAVSNLLNLCDGLLSDCLGIQVICTFNTDLSQIDNALLRKGRLIAQYEFKPLEQKKTNSLMRKLYPCETANQPMTLSDIYNFREKEFLNEKKRIGF